ncbi:anti-FecI sigma factor, FecR [Cellulophaga algicola DSM 14237]|uniref:Anti-FecI sigma factor, FecR n=1 Tax=Cellulophaga algicola (strain DSM 14237 / IC166 / ACAM 630) TaxID=688270 RepID=E6XE43_CELAD|nr:MULTISPECIES: FecR domain-containing protein [Cellulophaga]ADV48109.1 anti-FecI sigma factor, FecR [Cellulophaga algicola DSM 14237]
MNKSQLNNIEISKFLNNTLTPGELIVFKDKLEVSENVDLLKKYIVINHLFEIESQSFDSDVAFEKFLAKKIEYNSTLKNSFYESNKSYLLAAASICLLVGLSFLVYFNKYHTNELEVSNQIVLKLSSGEKKSLDESKSNKIYNKQGEVVAVQKGNSIRYNYKESTTKVVVNEFNEIYVPYGKRMEIVLSDGSRVHLNSGSSLKYPTFFTADQKRIVELKGEAYFDVAKMNELNRFVVTSDNFETTVLGTEFNVSSYDSDIENDVVLIEGSVRVMSNSDKEHVLIPGQQFKYSNTNPGEVRTVDVQSHIAWLDGVLFFENEEFKSILKKLERFYDVSIDNNCEALWNEKFTGQFDLESIEDVLETFKNTVPFNFELKNQKVVINPLNS